MHPPLPVHSPQVTPLCQRLLMTQTCLYCLLALAGAVYVFLQLFSGESAWLPVVRLLLAADFTALAFVENSLRCHGQAHLPPPETDTPTSPPPRRRLPPGLQVWLVHFQQHLLVTAVTALLAIVFALANITDQASPGDSHPPNVLAIGVAVTFCFALLVVERILSFKTIRGLREQQEHTGLARIMLSISLLLAASLLLALLSPAVAIWPIKLASAMTFLVALEYLLRTLMALGTPAPADSAPRFLTRSQLIALYQWPPRPLGFVLDNLQQRFGVDIRHIQAFRVIGNRLVPVTCGIAVLGWLLSGLTQVPLQQRGIYERFGRPVAVLAPGLHGGLPWPFGRVVPVENGSVHELQLSDISSTKQPEAVIDDAEGPAPQSSWRLWDNSHATDQSQVIASAAANSQNVQVVNTDIRLIWRIGLKDRDALNSQYQTDALPALIRSVARQVLVTQFASKQLDELLNEQRATMATTLNTQIQQRLNALNTGVELLFTRIEAIHPPAGAAAAYHGVQAAQIAADALIVREKGYAASVNNAAQDSAQTHIDNAQAVAAENLSQARTAAANFAAEHQAWQQAGNAFISERRYHILSQTLAHTPLLILDSHLQGANAPVLDLRQYPALSDSTAPQKASTK